MELRILGPIELVADGELVPLGAFKHRQLLTALAISDSRSCSTDELIDALWGDAPPPSAAKVLRIYVSQLRKLLPFPARVRTRAGGYELELEAAALDAARFERLLGEGKAAARAGNAALAASLLRRALALWRGQAFGELAYETFARAEAERLQELRLIALEERIDAELALGLQADVLPEVADSPTSNLSTSACKGKRCSRSTAADGSRRHSSATRLPARCCTTSSGSPSRTSQLRVRQAEARRARPARGHHQQRRDGDLATIEASDWERGRVLRTRFRAAGASLRVGRNPEEASHGADDIEAEAAVDAGAGGRRG